MLSGEWNNGYHDSSFNRVDCIAVAAIEIHAFMIVVLSLYAKSTRVVSNG